MPTGRFWQLLPDMAKLMYVQGAKDGIVLASAVDLTLGSKILRQLDAQGFFPGDYVKELDMLYQDRENLPIPLPFAYQYCAQKLKGELTKQQLEEQLMQLRKMTARAGGQRP